MGKYLRFGFIDSAVLSFYTDWFIADEGEAEHLATSDSPFEEWQSLSLSRIGEVDLMALSALLQRNEVAQAEAVSSELLYQHGDEGPFVIRVAPSFVEALANLSDTDQSACASAWSETEELAGAALSEVAQIVAQLSTFARKARLENKPVLGMFAL